MSQQELLCYVIMPFADDFLPTYRNAIRPAVENASRQITMPLVCRRSDDLCGPASITREIIDNIYRARVVIADLTSDNPNVFYELGIAHSAGNKTVMLARDVEGVPFDVHAYRIIQYAPTDTGHSKLRDALMSAIVQVCMGLELPTNPVHDFAPICHSSLVLPVSDVMEIERNVKKEVWLISPNNETDLKIFGTIVKDNISSRGVVYKYILPRTRTAIRSWKRFCQTFELGDSNSHRLQSRFVDEHQIESEVVIYDPHSSDEKVLMMSPIEESFAYFYHIRGSKADRVRERFEDLWDNASTSMEDEPSGSSL